MELHHLILNISLASLAVFLTMAALINIDFSFRLLSLRIFCQSSLVSSSFICFFSFGELAWYLRIPVWASRPIAPFGDRSADHSHLQNNIKFFSRGTLPLYPYHSRFATTTYLPIVTPPPQRRSERSERYIHYYRAYSSRALSYGTNSSLWGDLCPDWHRVGRWCNRCCLLWGLPTTI